MNDKNRHRSERNAYEKPDQNSFEKKNGHKKFHPTSSRGRVGLGLLATLPEKLQLGLRLWGFYPPLNELSGRPFVGKPRSCFSHVSQRD